MALVSGGRSGLNPNAPMFVPAAYRQVEDFSAAWWDLVKSSAWFRHYWLSQHQDDESFDGDDDGYVSDEDIFDDALSNPDADLEELGFSEAKADTNSQEKKSRNGIDTDVKALMKNLGLSVTETPKKRGARTAVGAAKYCEKVVPCLSPKMGSGRRIHQPR